MLVSPILYDFHHNDELKDWYVVNDGVMGGLSEGALSINAEGHALFQGFVSLDNYGGFTSIRTSFKAKDISEYTTIKLRIKGDGKNYQFRVKSDFDQRHSYITTFATTGEWETVDIALGDLYPSFRGRELNMPNFPGDRISEISILIANKKEERFALLIDQIGLE